MMKKCFLFTATVEKYMEDIMLKLFNVKAENFKNYRLTLSKVGAGICLSKCSYFVGKTEAQFWQIIEQ